MSKKIISLITLSLALIGIVQAEPKRPECIAPAQPGGGFDLTCRLAQTTFKDTKILKSPLRITYIPGGVGVVAYNTVIAQRPKDGNAIVAFSSGSLLQLAQGKFGKYNVNDVRWLASVGTDYGALIVKKDSPIKDLNQLMEELRNNPSKVVFGGGGSVGSQDWMKAALTAQVAGIDFKKMRYVPFEGGGDAFTALNGGHIQVLTGDASEAVSFLDGGADIRVLTVFSDKKLEGKLSEVPTAIEQGYKIEWPSIRGFYVGPKVTNEDYDWWRNTFNQALETPEFKAEQKRLGLFPLEKTGKELDDLVKKQTKDYELLAKSLGLIK